MHEIKLARVYDDPREDTGRRILVDRLWPRGKTKSALQLDGWAKAPAPSDDLRKSFHGGQMNFQEFAGAYRAELDEARETPEMKEFLREIQADLESAPVVFLFGAKSREENHALILRAWVQEQLSGRTD